MLINYIKKNKKTRKLLLDLSVLFSGLLLPFSFAPYHQFWLMFPLLSWLFIVCVDQAPKIAFKRGWLFSFGWLAHGSSWIYYSLHVHGGAPAFLAYLIIGLLAAYLSLFPGLVFYTVRKFFNVSIAKQLYFVFPLGILLAEWLRGYVLTGFSWVQLGYAQIDTPLAGYAPVIGGLGITGIVALISGLLAWGVVEKKYKYFVPAIFAIYLLGFSLTKISWVEPAGNTIKVSLIQGNIPQSEKWKRQMRRPTLDLYHQLTQKNNKSDLIIWPETAVPDFQHRVPYYLNELKKEAEIQGNDVLLGLFVKDKESRRYYNSVISVRDGVYKKRHLVPLGEFYPFRDLLKFLTHWINIPMSDVDSGPEDQQLITAAGQKLGVSICFEDAFDRDVLKSLPEATLLVNVSNDAWFEQSIESKQHHQIARMRALETGRYMLRATNTGVSSIINEKGIALHMSPPFERHVLTADVQPLKGSTPYVIWKNHLMVSLSFFILLGYWFSLRNKK
jgi:apolipoprotein N-acyltransferase